MNNEEVAISTDNPNKRVKVDIINGRRYLNGVHAFTYKRAPSNECHYYCFFSTEDQHKLNKFVDCMEQLQFVINNFTSDSKGPKELEVVINFPSDLTIPTNTLGSCFKFLNMSNWHGMAIGEPKDIVFYRFNDRFEIEECINERLQDDIVAKSIPKIKNMFFDSDKGCPLSDLSFQDLRIQ